MKKLLVLVLSIALVLSVSLTALAASDHSQKGNHGNGKTTQTTTENGKNAEKTVAQSATQKEFKQELNEQKKAVAQEKAGLEQQRAALEEEYEALLASGGDTTAIVAELADLDSQIAEKQARMKEIINERYMVVKTQYSEEELQSFDSVSALIEQMYADAYALDAGSIVVNDDMIKLVAPAYIKGNVTMVPIKTIEALGATVTWDETAKSVTVAKDNISVVITTAGSTVYVDGAATDTADPYDSACGRTYVPLRFLAETFGLNVTFDDENNIIDIVDPAAGDGTDTTATDTTGTDTTGTDTTGTGTTGTDTTGATE